MVSNYKRKTNKGSYSKEKLQEAVRAVQNGNLSGYKAAQIYKIPRMTIMDHVNHKRFKSKTLGRSTALDSEVEAKLANCIHVMEKYGFGLTKKELLELVGDYVNRNDLSTPFKDGIPGDAWFTSFKVRHNLSVKKPQGVEYARKKAVDPFIVYPYFDLLQKTLHELDLMDKPSAIWNLDETSFSKDPEKTRIVGAKGHAATRMIASPGRDNTTVLLCGNALGEKMPPLIIYKGKNSWDTWTSPDAYPGTTYAATSKGWMESHVFEKYFIKSFLPFVGDQRPILLIYDGHATHLGLNIIEVARKAGITILKLPAHTSHVLQPLDVAVMKSFKDRWDPLLVKWQRLNVGTRLSKPEFARLIGQVWKQIDGQVLRNGFRKTGIFPFNPNEIDEKQFDVLKLKRWKELKVPKPQDRAVDINSSNIPENDIVSDDGDSHLEVTKKEPKTLVSMAFNTVLRDIIYKDSSDVNSKQHIGEKTEQTAKCEKSNPNKDSTLNTDFDVDFSQNCEQPLLEIENKKTYSDSKKIQILEDKLVTFEELLLMRVKAGSNVQTKRRKIAPGAEVITHEDVIKSKIQEKIKNIKKEPQSRSKKQETNNTSKKSKKAKKLNKKNGKKTRKETSSEDSTSDVSDEMSIYSDVELSDFEEAEEEAEADFEKNNCIIQDDEEKEVITHNDVVNRRIREKNQNIKKESQNKSKMQETYKTSKKSKEAEKLNKNNVNVDENEESPKAMVEIVNNKKTGKEICKKQDKEKKEAKADSDKNNCIIRDDEEKKVITHNDVAYRKIQEKENIKKEPHNKLKMQETNKISEKSKRAENLNKNNINVDETEESPKAMVETVNTKKNCKKQDKKEKEAAADFEKNNCRIQEEKEVIKKRKIQDEDDKETKEDFEAETEIEETYNIDDTVLVRYYSRKKWTYFVGYVEDINSDRENCYSVRFYKTVKKPLRFLLSKKVDRDDVSRLCIVKKIILRQNPNNAKELCLSDNEDAVYFS